MIVYLVTEKYQSTLRRYLREWKPELAGTVSILAYEAVPGRTWLPEATYIFSDIERLGLSATGMAAEVWEILAGAGMRLLNHPARTLRRHELLDRLFTAGQNGFGVRRLDGDLEGLRYPVFLRNGNNHDGPLTGLLHGQAELDRAMRLQRLSFRAVRDMLVVEFCDTSDVDGLFRKYSAFMLGGEVIPRHLFFSRHWVQKEADLQSDELLAEQEAYVRDNPHADALRGIFRAAGVDYGRIDYGLAGGRIQVWEINTNPVLMHRRLAYPPQTMAVQFQFSERFADAMAGLDSTGGMEIPLRLQPGLSRAAQAEWLKQSRRRRLMHHLRKLPLLGRLT